MKYRWCFFVLTISLGLTGCGSAPMPEDQKVLEIRKISPATSVLKAFSLSREIAFVVPGGQGFLGDMKYRVLPGVFYFQGSDERGKYYRHEHNGIKRSGDYARDGGIFIPKDPNGRWGLWIFPNGIDATYGILGPAALAIGVPDQKTSIVYNAAIPLDLLEYVRSEVLPQLAKPNQ